MLGRMVGTVGGAVLDAAAAVPGAQISAAANALADASQLNVIKKHSARNAPARIKFVCKVNTVEVYTFNFVTTKIFHGKKNSRLPARVAKHKIEFTQFKHTPERKCR